MFALMTLEVIELLEIVCKMLLQNVKEGINILCKMKIRKVNWICLTLRRNCFLKYIFERKMGREQ